jgi:hypothetical protein
LLPQFALPYLRFSVTVIALFLMARLRVGHTLIAAGALAGLPNMPYQRGQFWIRRFQRQAESICAALALRGTCSIQPASGWRVMPPTHTRRLLTWMKNST